VDLAKSTATLDSWFKTVFAKSTIGGRKEYPVIYYAAFTIPLVFSAPYPLRNAGSKNSGSFHHHYESSASLSFSEVVGLKVVQKA
jgi:hypothetical protein